LKKFSEYEIDDGFVAKFDPTIDGVNGHWEDNENDNE
jgi:hypothetical protein